MVVCTRDRPEVLDRCLVSLRSQRLLPVEVIVVDNAPSDARAREIAGRHGARYVLEPALGLSRARNRGAAVATGEVVAYLDDDAIAEPEWVSALSAPFVDPSVGVVTGRCLGIEKGSSSAIRAAMERFWATGAEAFRVDRESIRWQELSIGGGAGVGMNMAFRRSSFAGWRGFDPRLGRGAAISGGEEQLAFFEWLSAGSTLCYRPSAMVRHPVPISDADLAAFRSRARRDFVAFLLYLLMERPAARAAAWRVVRGRASAGRRDLSSQGGLFELAGAVVVGSLAYLRALVQ